MQSQSVSLYSRLYVGWRPRRGHDAHLFQGTIWLMVSLFGVAGYFVLLSAPFLAAVQILVYIGAIAILITFAVMLTRSIARIQRALYTDAAELHRFAGALSHSVTGRDPPHLRRAFAGVDSRLCRLDAGIWGGAGR